VGDYHWYPGDWRGGPEPENQPRPAPAGYDWTTSKTFQRYKAMSDALLATDRTIEYSQCVWGEDHVDQWGNATGHSWRMWGDISPSWSSITPILNHAAFFFNSTDFWGHGDWDMLEVGNGDLTIEENRSHFALWAALKSPLLIGTPLDGINPEILGILSNSDLIAFNQDSVHGAPAKPYKWGVNADHAWNRTHPAEFWSGQSSNGTYVFVLNTLEGAQNKTVVFSEVPGLDATTAYTLYDSWTSKELGSFKKQYEAVVGRHDTMVLRVVKAGDTFFGKEYPRITALARFEALTTVQMNLQSYDERLIPRLSVHNRFAQLSFELALKCLQISLSCLELCSEVSRRQSLIESTVHSGAGSESLGKYRSTVASTRITRLDRKL
jgi:alpha-galactosidase